MCEGEEQPLCVKWCHAEALIYEEREEEVEEEVESAEEVELGIEALANKHGWSKVIDAVDRMSKKS